MKFSRPARRLLLICALINIGLGQTVALAISAADFKAVVNDTIYYDPNACDGTTSGSSNTGGSVTPGEVVIIGDSITMLSADKEMEAINKLGNGWHADAKGNNGGWINGAPNGEPSGLQQVDVFKDKITSAKAVIVGLGTNSQDPDYPAAVTQMIDKIKGINGNAKLFWVNMAIAHTSSADFYKGRNSQLQTLSTSKGFTVIDWFKTVFPNGTVTDGSPVLYDGIHPTPDAISTKYVPMITDALTKGGTSTTPATTTGGTPATTTGGTTATTGGSGGGVTGGKVYQLGDSLSVGMKSAGDIEKKYKDAGFDATVDANGGRAITSPGMSNGGGPYTTGLEAVDQDSAAIKAAAGIVIELGTNDMAGEPADTFKANYTKLLDKIHGLNADAKLFLVNISTYAASGHGPAYVEGNKVITDLAAAKHASVIDWDKLAMAHTDWFAGDSMKLHPVGGGYPPFAQLIVDTVKNGNLSSGSNTNNTAQCCPPGESGGGSDNLTGNDNIEKIWNYLTGKGLKPVVVAGIMGNMFGESGFDPHSQETPHGPDKSDHPLDTFCPIDNQICGYGLTGWTPGTEITPVAEKNHMTVGSLEFQLRLVWEESFVPDSPQNFLKDTPVAPLAQQMWLPAGTHIKTATTATQAAQIWETDYERHAGGAQSARWAKAEEILAKYGSHTGTDPGSGGSASGSGSGSGSSTTCGGGGGQNVGDGGLIQYTGHFNTEPTEKNHPTALVIHWWGSAVPPNGQSAGVDSVIETLNSRGLSVQVATTLDGKAYQLTKALDVNAPQAACANSWSIGNEIEGGGDNTSKGMIDNAAQFGAVVKVTEFLMKKFNIPIEGPLAADGNSGIGVHSHKEIDANCHPTGGKTDVDDPYITKLRAKLKSDGF